MKALESPEAGSVLSCVVQPYNTSLSIKYSKRYSKGSGAKRMRKENKGKKTVNGWNWYSPIGKPVLVI